jgi:F-box protein 9
MHEDTDVQDELSVAGATSLSKTTNTINEVEQCKNLDIDNQADDDTTTTAYTNVWFREEEQWELTWPIWHMLPREERRSLARQYGYHTIGEFEEYMILQQAVGDSKPAYDNKYAYPNEFHEAESSKHNSTVQRGNKSMDTKPSAKINGSKLVDDNDDDEDEDSLEGDGRTDVHAENESGRNNVGSDDDKHALEIMMENGGKILMLPDDMLHRIFDWLFVDMYATLALVSPHWKSFTRTEATYKRLCERLYLNQSIKRQLHVSRFNNSYRTMLEKRPRVRAGGGVYVMKYARIRKIQRDMFTDIPAGAVLEMVYYRYLYFEENGRVLYALTPSPPHEMFPRLKRVFLTGQSDRSAVWGTYKVRKTCVIVNAKQAWHHVQLTLSIDLENRSHGRYGCLTFDQHMTSVTGNFDDNDWLSDRIVYDVPNEAFRFIKDKRL